MIITREFLRTRLADLEKGREQALASLNAILGARQILDLLLAQLDAPDPEPMTQTETDGQTAEHAVP